MSIQQYLEKKKKEKLGQNLDLNQFVIDSVKKMVDVIWKKTKPEIVEDINSEVDKIKQIGNRVLEMQKNVKDGDKGSKGDKGDKGDTGPKGDRGDKGPKGDKGDVGNTGIQGRDGKDGQPGKDGSPDTPEQIANKLNTLTGKVETKVIKNFDNIIINLKKSIREAKGRKVGGGGLSATGTRRITVSTSPPSNPNSNDLWVDIS